MPRFSSHGTWHELDMFSDPCNLKAVKRIAYMSEGDQRTRIILDFSVFSVRQTNVFDQIKTLKKDKFVWMKSEDHIYLMRANPGLC